MSFNSAIPQPTDLISVSQQDLLNNFSSMQSTYTTDHYGFNPITNLGYHKQTTLVNDPLVVRSTAAGRMIEYAVTTNSQTYPVLQRDGTTTVYQALPIKAYCAFTAANPPVSLFTLPYGNVASITRISAGRYAVNFVDSFPAFAPNITYMMVSGTNFPVSTTPQLDIAASTAPQAVINLFPSSVDNGSYIFVAFIN